MALASSCPYVLSTDVLGSKNQKREGMSRRQDHLLFLMYIGTVPYLLASWDERIFIRHSTRRLKIGERNNI